MANFHNTTYINSGMPPCVIGNRKAANTNNSGGLKAVFSYCENAYKFSNYLKDASVSSEKTAPVSGVHSKFAEKVINIKEKDLAKKNQEVK